MRSINRISFFWRVLILLLLLLFIFHISFKPFPYFLRTRLLLLLLSFYFILRFPISVISLQLLRVIGWVILAIVPIILTSFINAGFDYWFIQNIFLTLIFLFSSYGVVKFIQIIYKDSFSVKVLFQYIVGAIALHNLIALVGFLVPGIGEGINSFQNQDSDATTVIDSIMMFQSRIIGLGIGTFFTGGITSSLALMICSYLIVIERGRMMTYVYILLFLFLALTGMFISRTTIVGFILAMIYMFVAPWFLGKFEGRVAKRNRVSFLFFLVTLTFSIVLFLGIENLMENSAFNHAFELFVSLEKSGSISTSSTEHMKGMYIFPDNFKTWIIGDGKFNFNGAYYKETDVGYLRLIYYYGVFGAVIYLCQQFYICKVVGTISKDSGIKLLFFFFAVLVIIINLKGIGDISYFLYLFLWFYILKGQQWRKELV